MITTAILLDERRAQGTPFAERHALVILGLGEVVVDLELGIVVGDLRAFCGKVRRIVASETHSKAARATHRAVRIRVEVDLKHTATKRRRAPFVVVQHKHDSLDRLAHKHVGELRVRRVVYHECQFELTTTTGALQLASGTERVGEHRIDVLLHARAAKTMSARF